MAEPTCDHCGYEFDDGPPVDVGRPGAPWLVHGRCELDARLMAAKDGDAATPPPPPSAAGTDEALRLSIEADVRRLT